MSATNKRSRPGTARPRPVRLVDVAREAGVSVATASIVLNQPYAAGQIGPVCTQRVRSVAERLGYVPNFHAQVMRGRRTGVVGVALQWGPASHNHLASGYFGTLIGAIDESLRHANHSMLIINQVGAMSVPEYGVLVLRRRQIDGLIVGGMTSHVRNNPVLGQPPGLPMVVLEYGGKTEWPVVSYDEAGAIKAILSHVVELGHRNLLWLAPTPPEAGSPGWVRERLLMQGAADHGLSPQVCRFPYSPHGSDPELELVDAAAAGLSAHFLSHSPSSCTAIICQSDLVAMGAYATLAGRGLSIPRDVSVTGFDDIQARLLSPKLTSASHALPEMGTRAVELLFELIQSPDAMATRRGLREHLPAELVVRESTARAPGGPRRGSTRRRLTRG